MKILTAFMIILMILSISRVLSGHSYERVEQIAFCLIIIIQSITIYSLERKSNA